MISKRLKQLTSWTIPLAVFLSALTGASPSYGLTIGPGADLAGADLSGRNLLSVYGLNGADLSNANLSGATFDEISFDFANLSGANLSGLIANRVWFRSANLTGADITNVNFNSPKFEKANLSGANLNGSRFYGAQLTDAILTNATLTNVDLRYAHMPNANLRNANLGGADLLYANLVKANLQNVNLDGTSLADASLSGVVSGGITGTPTALPSGWKLINGSLTGRGANLEGADFKNQDLSDADLSDVNLNGVISGGITGTPKGLSAAWRLSNGYLLGAGANLRGADLTGADLSGANLTGADLTGANLRNQNLTGTNLANTKLTGVASGGIAGTPSSLPAGWKLIGGYLIGPGANLDGADLKPLTLTGVTTGAVTGTPASLPTGWKLINGYLIGPGANLDGADLKNQSLAGANLINATLTGVLSGGITGTPTSLPTGWKLIGGYLIGSSANLTGANLNGLNLAGATLANATLTGVMSGGITGTPTALPAGWKLINGYLIGSGANLTDANLTDQNLNLAILANANLTGVVSGGITGTPTSLPADWKLIRGYLIGPGANLDGASLTNSANLIGVTSGGIIGTPASLPAGWKLISGYLIGAGANLDGASLATADLSGVMSGGITGTPASLPAGWKLISGYLIGPGANLDGANLANANLSDAQFTNASLSRVSSGGITGTPASLPPEWRLINGFLIGPGANLKDANLFGFDLEGSNLRGADLTQADLRGASIEQASLEGAILDRVKSGGTIGFPESLPARWTLTGSYLIGPRAQIGGLDLSGTDLTGVSSGELSGTPAALPIGWSLVAGYLVGPGANLESSNFVNISLNGLDLTNSNLKNATLNNVGLVGTNLEGALLEGASLTNVSSGELIGTPANLPNGWQKKYGYLFGPSANFTNALLRGADLSSIDLTGVNFSYAKLSDANFTNTDLSSANFSFAEITRADFSGAKITDTNFYRSSPKFESIWVEDEETLLAARLQTYVSSPTLSGTIKVGQTITAQMGEWDSRVTMTYQWFRNDSPIEGANMPDYALTIADLNSLISVSIRGTMPGYAALTKRSLLANVEAGTFTDAPTPTVSGTFKVGQTLTAATGTWDTGVALGFQWLRDGVSIEGATNSTYLLSAADSGRQLAVSVIGEKTGYVIDTKVSVAQTVEAGVLSNAPTPTTSGKFKVGQALTAIAGGWDVGVALSYQWLRGGTIISGATAATYTTTPSDLDKQISVRVTGTLGGYAPATTSSVSTKVTTGLMVSVPPKISGVGKSGSTLKVMSSAWIKGAKLTYQWLANGAAIKGATASSFKLTTAQKGKKVSVKVTQVAAGYSSASSTSSALVVSK
jgi:uncharacterized protein YjbI with pentapeptide repeats